MDRKTWNRIGIGAVILLAPGGFVLGAGLAAKAWRTRRSRGQEEAGALPPRPRDRPQEERR